VLLGGNLPKALIALQKLLTLDAQLAMATYIDRQQRELEYLTEELASEGRRVAQDYEQQATELRVTADRARAAFSVHAEAEDLIGIGAYQAGHDRTLDEAVRLQPALARFLCQQPGESVDLEQSFADLDAFLFPPWDLEEFTPLDTSASCATIYRELNERVPRSYSYRPKFTENPMAGAIGALGSMWWPAWLLWAIPAIAEETDLSPSSRATVSE